MTTPRVRRPADGLRTHDAVRIQVFGDHYGRPGVVTGRVGDLAAVELDCGGEEFFPVTDLEFVARPA